MHAVGLEVHAAVMDGGAENRKFVKMNTYQETDKQAHTRDM